MSASGGAQGAAVDLSNADLTKMPVLQFIQILNAQHNLGWDARYVE
jgi:hypothetical protein